MKRLVTIAALALGALGCAAEGPSGEAQLELGTGSWRFEPVEDGDTVDLVRGAQGGWHFWLSARATEVPDDAATLGIELQLADESRPAQRAQLPVLFERPDEEGRRAVVGLTAVVDDPGCAVDQLLRVTVTLDTDEGTLTDERMLLIGEGADPPRECGAEPRPGG